MGLGGDHFLGRHGHEVAEEHGGGGEEDFAEGKGWKDEGQAARFKHASFDGFYELGHGAMAGGVVGRSIGDADDGPL